MVARSVAVGVARGVGRGVAGPRGGGGGPTVLTLYGLPPIAVLGQAYSYQLFAVGGTPGYTYSIAAGTLPTGLSLSASGLISGTPTVASAPSITFRVTDADTDTADLTVTVEAVGVLDLTGTPSAVDEGNPFSFLPSLAGGKTPLTYDISAGTLPAWASINPGTGQITGTPRDGGLGAAVTIRVQDYSGQTDTLPITIVVNNVITPPELSGSPSAVNEQAAFSFTATRNGGVAPFTYNISAGALPAWASLNTTTGAITGTPADGQDGVTNVTLRVVDSRSAPDGGPQAATLPITITVNNSITAPVLSGAPTAVYEGAAFSFTASLSGGVAPFTYDISAGTLPSWASLNTSTGAITGTPADGDDAATDVTLRVTDSRPGTAQTSTLPITITVLDVIVPGTGFDPYYDPGFALRTDTTYTVNPGQTRPVTRPADYSDASYIEAVFDTRYYRATDITDATGVGGQQFMRQEYSRKQAFNCDGTLFMARSSGGYWWVYDAVTLRPIDGGRTSATGLGALGSGTGQVFGADCEALWHPTDPNKIWRTDTNGSLTWYEFNLTTKVTTTLFTLSGKLAAFGLSAATRAWFQAEGRCSNDGRYWCFSLQDNGFNQVGFCTYDRQTDTVLAGIPCTNKPNNVSISPYGNYGIISWSNSGTLDMAGCAAAGINSTNGTRAYTRDLTSFQQLSYYGEHADTAVDAEGNEVYVAVNYNSAKMPDVDDGGTYYRRCDNGVAYNLPYNAYATTGHSVHFSGCMSGKIGWALTGAFGGSGETYDGELFFQELVPTGARILRLGFHYSAVNDYWSEPHSTVSHDGTMILAATDWGTTTNFESVMIGLPSDAIPTAGGGSLTAPANTVAPVISGATPYGSTLTVTSDGTWTGNPTPTLAGYQWQNSGLDIVGETGDTYETVAGDLTDNISCEVSYTNSQGTTAADSNSITVTAPVTAPTVRASTEAAASNANNVTSPAITTVSGDLLLVLVCWQTTSPDPVVTDSKGNTYALQGTPVPAVNGGFTYLCGIFACYGNVSVGGSGHTFTATRTNGYLTIFPMAIAGANATAPFDGILGGTDAVNPVSSGDVTPTGDGRLIVSGLISFDATAMSVAPPYAVLQSLLISEVTYWSGAVATYTQSTAAATSAQWTVAPEDDASLITAVIKG